MGGEASPFVPPTPGGMQKFMQLYYAQDGPIDEGAQGRNVVRPPEQVVLPSWGCIHTFHGLHSQCT